MRLEGKLRPGAGVAKTTFRTNPVGRVGVTLPGVDAGTTPGAMSFVARRAESLGFDSIWLLEDHDALTSLAYLAGATSSIGLGTRLPVIEDSSDFLRRVASLASAAAGRVAIAAEQPVGLFDASVALQVRARLVEFVSHPKYVTSGAAYLARCQVSYQPLEDERSPFHGTFDQIAEDVRRFVRGGCSDLILDLTHSASVEGTQSFVMHLERLAWALGLNGRHVTATVAEDPFDYIT